MFEELINRLNNLKTRFMRTKFNLLATLLMVVLCVSFTSCSDDEKDEIQDDKTLALLIGSWEYELSSFTDEEGNVVSRQMEIVTFNSDMSWTGVDYYIEVGYPDKETENGEREHIVIIKQQKN